MSRAVFASGALLASLLLAAAPTFAAGNGNEATGSTTGPAAGGNVKPNTTMSMQKHGQDNGTTAVHPSIGAGAAGVNAKPNTEGGPATKSPGNSQQQQ